MAKNRQDGPDQPPNTPGGEGAAGFRGRRVTTCSFCGKTSRDVGPMVEGPNEVYICANCVDLCQNIFKQERRRVGSVSTTLTEIPTPRQISQHLDQYVIGQTFAKRALSVAVHAHYKQAIVQADATGTYVLNKKSSPCIRALKTGFSAAIHEQGLLPPDAFHRIREVYFDGDMEAAPALAGQSAGLIHAVKSAQQIIDDTVAQFFAITRRLGSLADQASFG